MPRGSWDHPPPGPSRPSQGAAPATASPAFQVSDGRAPFKNHQVSYEEVAQGVLAHRTRKTETRVIPTPGRLGSASGVSPAYISRERQVCSLRLQINFCFLGAHEHGVASVHDVWGDLAPSSRCGSCEVTASSRAPRVCCFLWPNSTLGWCTLNLRLCCAGSLRVPLNRPSLVLRHRQITWDQHGPWDLPLECRWLGQRSCLRSG